MKNETGSPGWVIWFVGLPGSGKSTYAQAVYGALKDRGKRVQYLSMDERRRVYVPEPNYTSQERNQVYRLFAEEAARIAGQGTNVIMDGTAPELSMREYARGLVERFAEIYVSCTIETAVHRETNRPQGLVMAELYQKAIKRQQTGEYFEGLGDGRDLVLEFLDSWQSVK